MRNTLKLIITLLLLCAYAGFAQVTIHSHNNYYHQCYVQPCINIINDGTSSINLKDYTIDYYFYDENNTASQFNYYVWDFTGNGNVSIEFSDYTPPFVTGDKKADIKCRISFGSNTTLSPGDGEILKIGLVKYWVDQNQEDDWSFVSGSDYKLSENIVVRDLSGNIVFGNEPGNSVQKPDPIPMNWLGYIDNPTFQDIDDAGLFEDGDGYRNSDDDKSYVRYKGVWQEISGTGGTGDYINGFTMNDNTSHIDMTGANIVDVNRAETIDLTTSFLRLIPHPTEKPNSEFDTKGLAGDISFYKDGGEWYLYIKVDSDPHEWKRVKLTW